MARLRWNRLWIQDTKQALMLDMVPHQRTPSASIHKLKILLTPQMVHQRVVRLWVVRLWVVQLQMGTVPLLILAALDPVALILLTMMTNTPPLNLARAMMILEGPAGLSLLMILLLIPLLLAMAIAPQGATPPSCSASASMRGKTNVRRRRPVPLRSRRSRPVPPRQPRRHLATIDTSRLIIQGPTCVATRRRRRRSALVIRPPTDVLSDIRLRSARS